MCTYIYIHTKKGQSTVPVASTTIASLRCSEVAISHELYNVSCYMHADVHKDAGGSQGAGSEASHGHLSLCFFKNLKNGMVVTLHVRMYVYIFTCMYGLVSVFP